MNDQKPNGNFLVVGNEYGETKDSPSKTIIYHNVNDLDTGLSGLHSSLNNGNGDLVECLDFQRSTIEQGNIILSLKLSDYEKASEERDNDIKSLYTSVMNSRSKNCVVTNHYNNLMEKDENKKHMDIQLNTIKEQTELLDDLKIYKELNDTLKKENEHLKKINTALVDDINSKFSQNEIQKEKENKHKVMCKNYIDFLKMQEDKLQDTSKKLKLQKVRENDLQNEIIDLKQQVEMSNTQIINLQDEVQTNCVLIPELQSKIDGLSTELAFIFQKLQKSVQALAAEKNALEKQNKDSFKQIEKLTSNCMKYKTVAKQLYKEVARLRYQYSIPEQKIPEHPPTSEIIEISDEDINFDEDVSVVELNNQGIPNMKVSIQPNSNKINQIYNSSYKRHFLSLKHDGNSGVKKRRVFLDIASDQKTPSSATIVKYNNDSQQIDSSMSSSFRSINLKHEDINCTY